VSNPVQSVSVVNPQTQAQAAAPPPKTQQNTTQSAAPQDKVTISESAKQALADTTKPAAGGDVDHDGDSR
jgi:hypothetical protein